MEMKDRMKCLARDLGVVSQDYREKCASLKSVEELKSQTCFLDNEIKQKSEVSRKKIRYSNTYYISESIIYITYLTSLFQ